MRFLPLFAVLGLTSCAHVGPVVSDFIDCAKPEMQQACSELRPRVIDALICSGGNTAALPACALAELADLANDHGKDVVLCAVVAIRDAFSLPSVAGDTTVIKARAAEYVRQQEARGVKLRAAP